MVGTERGARRGLAAMGAGVLVVLALVAAAAGPALLRPAVVEAQEEGQALVRFVNASPDAPALDVYVDGEAVVSGGQFTFGSITAYTAIPSGDRQIQVVSSGQQPDAALFEVEQGFDDGGFYEIVAQGLLNDIEGRVLDVDTEAIEEPGTARVRVVHLSPDAGEIDVAQTGSQELLFEGLEFPDAGDYTALPSGPYDLEVRPSGEETVVTTAPGQQVEPGFVYDILIIGQASNQTLQLLILNTPVGQPCTDVLGVGGTGDGCIRVVHASPGGPDVDVYVGDATEPAVAGLAFGAFTEYVALPEGERQIRVVSTGADPAADPLVEATVEVEAGKAYELVASNVPDEIELSTFEVDLGPLPENQARVRVIHLAPNADDIDVALTGGEVLFGGLGFGDAGDYRELDAVSYDLEVRAAGEEAAELRAAGIALQAGMVYDLFAVGDSEELASVSLLEVSAPAAGSPGAVGPATPEATPDLEGPEAAEVTQEAGVGTPAAPPTPTAVPAG